MLRELNDWLLRRADRRLEITYPRRNGREGGEGSAGVPVPVGPRPWQGGAQARPPEPVKR
ncbi:hypothetical protein [uncultured Deinococcus sp.]|uniref:hypothetical protein n=1 Tax=uncultured Deinococcus sp. TaxID=158789 RepID=UPI0025DAB9F5|nr:hypothetical protein [uncultured Deinococcus sp.]